MKKEDLEIILDAKMHMMRAGGSTVLTCEELVRGDDVTWDELEKGAEKVGLGGKVKKIRSLVHLNNLEYVRCAEKNDPMLQVIMKRLGAEFGYVERRDVTSKGEKVELNVIIPKLLENV